MKLLKQLSSYLIDKSIFDRDAYSAHAESARLQWIGESIAEDGSVQLFVMAYDAVISIERFNETPAQLFTHVMLFLSSIDYDFDELGDPEFDADPEDDSAYEIEITLRFEEPVHIVPSAAGDFEFQGEAYDLAEPDIWVAEEFDLVVMGCLGGDLETNT